MICSRSADIARKHARARTHQELGVVLVAEGREGDGGELARLQPVHRRRVDRHGLLCSDVRPILRKVCEVGWAKRLGTRMLKEYRWMLVVFLAFTLPPYCPLNNPTNYTRPLTSSSLTTPQPHKHLEVVVLALVLGLQIQAGEAPQVLLAHDLVHRRTPPDPLPIGGRGDKTKQI